MKLKHVFVILGIALILLATFTEAKRRPGRRRQKQPKRPSRLSSLIPWRSNKDKSASGGPQESKRVFYYTVPKTTLRPRIILGDELNFGELGIKGRRKQKQVKELHLQLQQAPSQTASLSTLEHDIFDEIDMPIPHPPLPGGPHRYPHKPRGPPGKRPRSRGPGYRLERPWQEHYVLEGDYRPLNERHNYAVMPYLKKAGKNLVGAYRAAVLKSSEVAHFTGHAASRYFKGVRNLLGARDPHNDRSDNQKNMQHLEILPESSNTPVDVPLVPVSAITAKDEEPIEIELIGESSKEEGGNGVVPKVYLDWGGSFWKIFYNKSKDMPPPEKKKA